MHGKTEDVNCAEVLDEMFLSVTQKKVGRWYMDLFGDFFESHLREIR